MERNDDSEGYKRVNGNFSVQECDNPNDTVPAILNKAEVHTPHNY